MSDTILRHLEMLRLIPHWPNKIDTSVLQSSLSDSGYMVSNRTIQRDLHKLSRAFPLVSDDTPGHFGWSWMKDAEPMSLSSMPAHVAVTFVLVEQFLPNLLPSSSSNHLKSYFKTAKGTLDSLSNKAFLRWTEKVEITQRSQAMLAPEVNDEITQTVYQGLFNEKVLEIQYCSPGENTIKSAQINPLGLLVREPVIYLVCTFWDYQDIRQLPLHRICKAELTESATASPDGFSLKEFIRDSGPDIHIGDEIELHARVSSQQSKYLAETPIANNQSLYKYEDGSHKLVVTVKDTIQLRRWILSLTGEIEIIEPLTLRQDILSAIELQLTSYQTVK